MSQSLRHWILLFCLSFFLFAPSAWAGQVFKVKGKGKKILIKLSPEEEDIIEVGDKLYITTSTGKKKALVIVRKKRGLNVIARLKKGKAKPGMKTRLRKSKRKKMQDSGYEEASEVAKEENRSEGKSDLLFGLIGSYGSAAQEVTGVADMSGSSIGFKGLIDYALFEDLGVRGRFGLDMFSVTGSDGTNSFTTDINYITVDLLLRYYIINGESFGLFVNGGMGIYSPLSSDLQGPDLNSDGIPDGAITEESISTTSLLIFGAGVSFPIGSWQLFAGFDYYYYPPSDDVSTSVIGGKVGVLFEL